MATSDDIVSSTEDYSCSTCSYGDSGFSDSRAFLKELPSSSSEPVQYPREQGLDTTLNSNVLLHASLTATDVHTAAGYYKSLNQESRIPGSHFSHLNLVHSLLTCISDVVYYQANASGQSSSENKIICRKIVHVLNFYVCIK